MASLSQFYEARWNSLLLLLGVASPDDKKKPPKVEVRLDMRQTQSHFGRLLYALGRVNPMVVAGSETVCDGYSRCM